MLSSKFHGYGVGIFPGLRLEEFVHAAMLRVIRRGVIPVDDHLLALGLG